MLLFTPLQRILLTWILLVAGGWALLQVLEFFQEFVTIFVIAGLIAFLLSYPVKLLDRYLPRIVAALLVYSIAGLAVAVLVLGFGPSVSEQAAQLFTALPDLIRSGIEQIESIQRWAASLKLPFSIDTVSVQIAERIQDQVRDLTSQSLGLVVGTVTRILDIVLILVISFYMLLDGGRLWQVLLGLLPVKIRSRFSESLEFNLRGFFTSQLILGLFMTAILTPTFLFLGLPFGLLFGLFIGLMELIPFIGATLGIGVVVLFSLAKGGWFAIQILIICVAVQQVKDNILTPRIMGSFTGLNPVIIFGALLLGAKVAGLLGVLLAIPVTGVVKSLFETLQSPDEEAQPIQALPIYENRQP